VRDELLYRLRKRYECNCTIVGRRCDVCNDRHNAADKIENLSKEIEVLRTIAEHYKFLYEMQKTEK